MERVDVDVEVAAVLRIVEDVVEVVVLLVVVGAAVVVVTYSIPSQPTR